ncbi:MAG: hypothetical protein QM477_01670 [Planctomycetota bacterium]
MAHDSTPTPPAKDLEEDGSVLEGVPGYLATMCLGIGGLGIALIAYLPELSFVAYIDLPMNFIGFIISAIVGMGARKQIGLAVTGVIFSAAGLILSALHLITVHNHPWIH